MESWPPKSWLSVTKEDAAKAVLASRHASPEVRCQACEGTYAKGSSSG